MSKLRTVSKKGAAHVVSHRVCPFQSMSLSTYQFASRRKSVTLSLCRCEVAGAKSRSERRLARFLRKLHLDTVVFAVMGEILWRIIEHVFIPKLYADLSGDVGKLSGIYSGKSSSSRLLGEFT